MEIFLICVVGIILNWILLIREADKSPEGGMGMGLMYFGAFIPWLVVVLWIVAKIFDALGISE